MNKEVTEDQKKKIETLRKEMDDFIASKLPLQEYIKRKIMSDYLETGDKKLEEFVHEYFIENL